ncbi:hypothetical protein BJY04DRAFT_204705 [Aspergillus karnatakaensis]|uniref:uncharacterized protein n=1 Tax=Aspergillus karnatakaensis TaxID=1810916 RepID=UPI003CCD21AD
MSSRQRPVSCHFCRSRKLRCSRRFPCPNCTSRGISCHLYHSHVLEPRPENQGTDILARLQRLEDIVLRRSENTSTSVDMTPSRATEEARWLELECSIQGYSQEGVVFRVCDIRQIQSVVTFLPRSCSDTAWSENITRCFWLPQHEESMALAEKYIKDLTCLVHVIHIPSFKRMVSHIYQNLDAPEGPRPSHIALLMSIIAFSLTAEEANRCARIWLRATVSWLEYSQAHDCSLEEIQARIITSSIVSNLEGVSRRYRNLILSAITGARELKLHRLDHEDGSAARDNGSNNAVAVEIGRRMWWYLTVTDWVLSHYEGPMKGTYTINPRHMSVREPRNVKDADLGLERTVVERSTDYPTQVSYTLQRTRLGELCRELTDRTVLGTSDSSDYSLVLEMDKKMNAYIEAFPYFFQLDGGSLKDIAAINSEVAPGIIVQRYVVNILAYAHRCRLHLPYFARGSVNSKYRQSRNICLHAARGVIRTERHFAKESVSFVPTRFRFAGSLHCLCMAIIVFILDVCLYKEDVQQEERKREAADACSILQIAKNDSSIAAKLLQSFLQVIRKHKVSIHGIANGDSGDVGEPSSQPSAHCAGTEDVFEPSYGISNLATEQDLLKPDSTYWNGISETFDNGLDTIDWNALFFDLETQGLDGGSLV